MNEKLMDSISDLLKDKKSDKVILKALKFMLPSRRRWIFIILVYIVLVLMFNILFDVNNPIGCAVEIFDTINILLLPILTIAVTGYAIFQALVSGNTLITLLEVKGQEYSNFKEYNYFFLSFSVLYLFSVILNFVLGIIFSNVSPNLSIPSLGNSINFFLFTLMISTYLVFIINLLVEVKCFLFNLHQVFVTNAIASGIEEIDKRANDSAEKNE